MYKKLLKKALYLFLSFSLLLQNTLPVYIYAEELSQEPTPTEIITPSAEPTAKPTADLTQESSLAAEPVTEASPTEQTPKEEISFDTPTAEILPEIDWTFKNVSLITYSAPQNDKVKITFTKLPDTPGNILIKEIKLTPEQITETGSLTDTAYDITSDMENGTFAYNLELPIPESVDKDSVEIKYTENVEKLDEVESLENEIVENEKVTVENIDHFTLFFVTATLDSTDGSLDYISVNDYTALSASDDVRMPSDGRWHRDTMDNWEYLEFRFNPGLDEGSIISTPVKLIFEYQRDSRPWWSNDYEAQLLIRNTLGNWIVLSPNVRIDDGEYDEDKTFNINIPSEYTDTVSEINNLRIRFRTNGYHSSFDGIRTLHDYVALDFSYSNTSKINICHNTSSAQNPWEAIRIDDSAWETHQTHHDFIYSGPIKPNGHPDDSQNKDGIWCNENVPNYCGDGNIAGGEQCDDGDDNEISCTADYDQSCSFCSSATCTTETITGPYCGDGQVNGNEQCDGGETCDSSCHNFGNLRVVKTIQNNSKSVSLSSFSFKTTINGVESSVTANADTGIADFGPVPAGSYIITETGPSGYFISSTVNCSKTSYNTATVSVSSGANVSCEIVNNGIPYYTGENSCGKNQVERFLATYNIDSQDEDGELITQVEKDKTYLYKASGAYVPTSASGYVSDAAYTTINSTLSNIYGIMGTNSDYAAHALLGNLGLGVGVINWGVYNPAHEYQIVLTSSINSPQFVIGDRFSNWFGTPWDMQTGQNDNKGSLKLDVYECIDEEVNISVTKTADKSSYYPGNNVKFAFNYSVTGNAKLAGATLTDEIPAGMEFSTTGNTGWVKSGNTLTYNLGTLTPAKSGVVYLNLKVANSFDQTSISNTVTFSGTKELSEEEISESSTKIISILLGSIKVCKIILDSNGDVVTGSANPNSSFSINWLDSSTSQGAPVSTPDTASFTTGLSYNNDLLNFSKGNDSQCTTYTNIPFGNYYYDQEVVEGNGWKTPKYFDSYSSKLNNFNNFAEYSGQLFDNVGNNDGQRNTNSDGHILLTTSSPNRTLVVLNQYNPFTIVASKVVCDSESKLPNNTQGAINANTAQGWVDSHPGCWIERDWDFQWSPAGGGSFGPFQSNGTLLSSPWNSITSGTTSISDLSNLGGRIEVREVIPNDSYVPFSNGSNESAEFYCTGDTANYDNWEWINNPQYGQTYYCVGFNALKSAKVNVYKYQDDDADGEIDWEVEKYLSGWEMNLSGKELEDTLHETTDSEGMATFENLIPGSYNLSETLDEETGWIQSGITCSNDDRGEYRKSFKEEESNSKYLYLNPGDEVDCYVGNYTNPELSIHKVNDAIGDKSPGSSIVYTIFVKVSKAMVKGLTVKDLLPEGFKYRSGSFKAMINGNPYTMPEPEYHSPGLWQIGDVNIDDEIELTYTADVSSDQQPGYYQDVALAQGVSLSDNLVVALADPSSYVDDNFAGTNVSVIRDQTRGDNYSVEKIETIDTIANGQVLGASTDRLPNTGANPFWILASLVMLATGLKLVKSSSKE